MHFTAYIRKQSEKHLCYPHNLWNFLLTAYYTIFSSNPLLCQTISYPKMLRQSFLSLAVQIQHFELNMITKQSKLQMPHTSARTTPFSSAAASRCSCTATNRSPPSSVQRSKIQLTRLVASLTRNPRSLPKIIAYAGVARLKRGSLRMSQPHPQPLPRGHNSPKIRSVGGVSATFGMFQICDHRCWH